ncbi:protein LSM12 homolog isoform X2 [Durio zibethinus]|uniref:Protein LSM12 homolog isoform X2 n=1 Tax=Durio zibethinus TaxID=66656 RepID=A0A6P5XDD3_DURZI|nr:protein LSM12 homolog isoform X2 [Durio zibethinus]XP_022725867.1 protein LSM12 homolog isoform X2 [Durio zibethinus]
MEGEEFAVGCFLSIKTTLGDEFEAQIISFDTLSNILVLKEKSGPRWNIRLLKANYIKEFSLLRQGEDPLDVNKCFLDLTSLQAREESALRQADADSERFGVGVTSEAQILFDALSKTWSLKGRGCKLVVLVCDELTFELYKGWRTQKSAMIGIL